ncbi:MAG: hypothetical protein ACRDJU_06745 [Actinomycetota bacterium]
MAIGLLITAIGSYGLGWSWTGFRGNRLWDWLHLLLVPVVLGAQPLWVRSRLGRHTRTVLLPLLVTFGGFVAVSYWQRWGWTGFEHQRLWDWLNLVVLPAVLAFAGLWLYRPSKGFPRYWRPLAGVGVLAFVVVAVGGYRFGWAWTGFQGNRLWDWLNLLVLPFAVPVAFLWIGTRLEEEREEGREERPATSATAAPETEPTAPPPPPTATLGPKPA